MSSPDVQNRIAAAKRAVLAQTDRLHREFGRVESKWKADESRVTAADIAISEGIVAALTAEFPADQFFSEELEIGIRLWTGAAICTWPWDACL